MTLTVGSLVAYLDVKGDADRELAAFDKDMATLEAKTKTHVDGIERQFKRTGTAAASAGASMQEMADKVTAAQKRLTAAHDGERDALAKVIAASNDLDFERIGGDTDKLTAAQKRLDKALAGVAKSQKDVASASKILGKVQAEFAKAGEESADSFKRGATSLLSRIGPGLAVAAIPVATLAGGAIAGAMVLGFGAGLVGLGIAAGVQFQHVRDEWSELGRHIRDESRAVGEPFAQAMIDIRHQVGETVDFFVPALTKASKLLAPAVSEFSGIMLNSLRNLEPAIEPITRGFNSLLRALGDRMPGVMAKVSRGMTNLAESVEKNPEALADMVDGLASATEAFLNFLAALNKAYTPVRNVVGWLADLNDKIVDLTGQDDDLKWHKDLAETPPVADAATEALDKTRQASADLAAAQEAAAEAAAEHAQRLEDLVQASDDVIGSQFALRDAIDAAEEDFAAYNDALKHNKRNSEAVSDAQLAAEESAYRVATAVRDAALAQQEGSGKARDLAGANIAARDKLRELASTASGPLRDAIYGQISALDQLIARLRSIPGTYAAKVQITVSQTGRYTGPALGALPAFARGGSIGPGQMGRVAETEPEILTTAGRSYLMMNNAPGHITPASQLGPGGSPGGGGASEMRITWDGRGLSGIDRAIWSWIKDNVRFEGGGDVQVALGRRR